jgi:hypothetical protein
MALSEDELLHGSGGAVVADLQAQLRDARDELAVTRGAYRARGRRVVELRRVLNDIVLAELAQTPQLRAIAARGLVADDELARKDTRDVQDREAPPQRGV